MDVRFLRSGWGRVTWEKSWGKQGQTIDAIRSITAAAATKYGEPIDIELVEDRPPQTPRHDPLPEPE